MEVDHIAPLKKSDKMVGRRFGCSVVIDKVPDPKKKNATYKVKCTRSGKFRIALKPNFIRKGKKYLCEECYWDKLRNRPNGALSRFYCNYNNNAKARGHCQRISFKVFMELVSLPCHYCGRLPAPIYRSGRRDVPENKAVANGLDRIDSRFGYSIKNVVPCCFVCNRSKMAMTVQEFLSHIHRIAQHQGWIPKDHEFEESPQTSNQQKGA